MDEPRELRRSDLAEEFRGIVVNGPRRTGRRIHRVRWFARIGWLISNRPAAGRKIVRVVVPAGRVVVVPVVPVAPVVAVVPVLAVLKIVVPSVPVLDTPVLMVPRFVLASCSSVSGTTAPIGTNAKNGRLGTAVIAEALASDQNTFVVTPIATRSSVKGPVGRNMIRLMI